MSGSIVSIDTGDGAGVTKIDHGCDGTVVSVECVQAEEVSLIGYIGLGAVIKRTTSQGGDNNESSLDEGITLSGSMSVSQGEQVSITGSMTLSGTLSAQAVGAGTIPTDGNSRRIDPIPDLA